MRVIFAGTPEFARVALERLHAAGFDIALVLTQPDRPAGRGMKLQASPVKQWAQERNIPLAQPRSLRLGGKYPDDAQAAKTAIDAAQADVMVVAAYGLILPQWVLDTPRLGCLNIHASLLPRWRGAAPIHRAIEAGDAVTGITIMQMDAGLDTGDMLLVEKLGIGARDSTATLHDKLAALGGRLVAEALEIAAGGGFRPVKQPAEGITYAHKIEKHEASIDWTQSAAVIERRIRAFNPFPGASSVLNGEVIKLQDAHVSGATGADITKAGAIFDVQNGGIDVVTGDGLLRITRLQKAGGKSLPVADFVRGFDVQPGMVFAPASA
ncbi:MAG: methionyl-tRNA formyltransferase [Polaromonas sp.]|jgi:methionyl-tRNA formyltransferase